MCSKSFQIASAFGAQMHVKKVQKWSHIQVGTQFYLSWLLVTLYIYRL